jgi:hypothetical protein
MEFSCKACGSPAVVYPDRLSDEAPIKCRRCGIAICTLSEFRLYAEEDVRAAGRERTEVGPVERTVTDRAQAQRGI